MKIKWLCIASGILLLLAVPSVAWGFYKSKLTVWIFVFISVAFLFNPIIPIHLVKSSWVLIDFVSAVLFFLAAFVFKEKEFK